MHYSSLLAAATVASVALAAPNPQPMPRAILDKRTFVVKRTINAKAVQMKPAAAMAQAFNKHGFTYDPSAGAPVEKRHGDVKAADAKDADAAAGGDGFDALRAWLNSVLSGEAPTAPAPGAGQSASTTAAAAKPKTTTAAAATTSRPAVATTSGVITSSARGNQTRTTATGAIGTTPEASVTGSSVAFSFQPSSATSAAAAPTAGGNGTATGGKQTGEAATTPEEMAAFYLTQINVGGQILNLNLDTGSADLWVKDKAVTGTGFNTKNSTGFKTQQGLAFKISYGDGSSAAGSVGMDTVKLGQATVQNQAVEVASTVSKQFSDDKLTDGLLGLAFSNINSVTPTKQKTFFDNIKPQLEQPLFTVTLNDKGAGEYEFGTIDASKYTGNITYTAVDSSKGFWQFTSTSFKVGDKVMQNTGASPAIADTGTTLALVDAAVAKAYYAQVQGATLSTQAGGYVYPCTATLPDFSVALGSDGYATVPGNTVTFAAVGDGTCFGGIQSNQGQPIQILGDTLLKNNFVVFDGGMTGAPRVGFAKRTNTPTGAN